MFGIDVSRDWLEVFGFLGENRFRLDAYRNHSIEFKRQVAQEFVSGETLRGLAQRHDLSRNLIRVWSANMSKVLSTTTPKRPT